MLNEGLLNKLSFEICTENKNNCFKIEELIEEWNKKDHPVAGVIVEPIQAEGGDFHASPSFFRALQRISKKVGQLIDL